MGWHMKQISFTRCRFLAALMAISVALPAAADPIATILAIRGTASGPSGPVAAGDRIEDGTVLRTNGNTQIELRFDDGTLMAVGPNSVLEVTSVLMASNGQASRFAINATGGTFRFLSGDSNNDVYEITTPSATIGIRGTELDISVGRERTGVALYRGRLRMCLPDGTKCWDFRGSCYIAEADPTRNRVRGLRPAAALSSLESGSFPFATSQRSLLPELQTITNACNKYANRFYDDPDDDYEEELSEAAESDPAESTEVTCEFDGEGLLCYDPVTDSFFYDFDSE